MTIQQQRKLLKDLNYTCNAPDKPQPKPQKLRTPEAWDWYGFFY